MDRTTRAALYARAGVREYWIVNLPERLVEVYRQPGPMPTQPLGHGYRSLTRHTEGETVAPVDFPDSGTAPSPSSACCPDRPHPPEEAPAVCRRWRHGV